MQGSEAGEYIHICTSHVYLCYYTCCDILFILADGDNHDFLHHLLGSKLILMLREVIGHAWDTCSIPAEQLFAHRSYHRGPTSNVPVVARSNNLGLVWKKLKDSEGTE